MKIGLPGDRRKFKKATKAQKEREALGDAPPDVTRWPRCEGCGMDIKGKAWRVGEGKFECFRCHNE